MKKHLQSLLNRLGSKEGGIRSFSGTALILLGICFFLTIFALVYWSDDDAALENPGLTESDHELREDSLGKPSGRSVTRFGSSRETEDDVTVDSLPPTTGEDWVQSVEAREQSKRNISVRGAGEQYRGRATDFAPENYQDNLTDTPLDSDPAQMISGRVVAETGEPLPGIRVSARAQRLFESVGGAATGTANEKWTLSDHEGRYLFAELDPGEYRIRSEATDGFGMAQTIARTGSDSANLVMPVEHVCWVYGLVTSQRGTPVEGVQVIARGQHSRTTSTNPSGEYEIQLTITGQSRVYQLHFELDGYRKKILNLPDTELFERDAIRLDAELERMAVLATVAGSVSDKRGTLLAGESVYLSGPDNYRAATDQAGEFVIPEVEANATYQLSVYPRGPYRKHVERIEVSPRGANVKIELESLDYASLSGRMMEASGNPIPNFTLSIHNTTASAQRLFATGDQDGRFFLEEVPTGQLIFTTHSYPRFTINGITLPPEGLDNVALILDLGRYQVIGRVVDRQGYPIATPYVTLNGIYQRDGVRYHSARQTASDEDGFFRFTEIGQGPHTITVRALGFRNASIQHQVDGNDDEVVVQLEREQ